MRPWESVARVTARAGGDAACCRPSGSFGRGRRGRAERGGLVQGRHRRGWLRRAPSARALPIGTAARGANTGIAGVLLADGRCMLWRAKGGCHSVPTGSQGSGSVRAF
jgi:hypothetical protein